MTIRFIVNPHSGANRRRPRFISDLEREARKLGIDAELVRTDAPLHAMELARDAVALGRQVIVSVGGDGTMNEIARALVHTDAVMGIIPMGSGNGLARHLGIPLAMSPALGVFAGSHDTLSIDTGTVNGILFVNAMGFGFDAAVTARFNRLPRRGLVSYVRAGLAAIGDARLQTVRVSADGVAHEMQSRMMSVLNSDQFGNNARIARGSSVTDGMLDLVSVGNVRLAGVASITARMFVGGVERHPGIWRSRASHFVIDREHAGPVHTDGELQLLSSRLEVQVAPASLRVALPSQRTAYA